MFDFPKTLLEAVRYFSDLDTCHRFMAEIKWPDGNVMCPHCCCTSIGEIQTRRMFQCRAKACRKQFSVKVGTIFEDSPLGLDKWLVAVWCIVNAKNGISSCELGRAIGVSQKSAWHMLHRIRLAMGDTTGEQLEGVTESDETFIGGKFKNMHKSRRNKLPKGRGMVGKICVHGILQRGDENSASKIRLKIVTNQKTATLQHEIKKNVKRGVVLYTDRLASYAGLSTLYVHEMIDHAIEYVRGEVHVNGMENFWSLLKRTLHGTYVSVAPKHLVRYCAEQARRFNDRKDDDATRFHRVMQQTVGRRLQWKELTSEVEPLAGCF